MAHIDFNYICFLVLYSVHSSILNYSSERSKGDEPNREPAADWKPGIFLSILIKELELVSGNVKTHRSSVMQVFPGTK